MITKTTKGYTIRWYDADGQERQRTYKGIDRDEAKKLERGILAARDRGEPVPDERRAPTFTAFAATWKEESRSGWKPSTQAQYEQVLKSQLRPAFGDLRLCNITESRVRQLVTQLQDAGLGARRINLVLLVLKMIMATAARRRLIRENPLVVVKPLAEPQVEVDPLAPDEIDGFLKSCPTWWRPYFTVAFWTGARPNELAALKLGDVDGPSSRFRIRAGRYRGVEGAPKTASSVRDVDMAPAVVEALRAQKAQQAAARLKAGLGMPEPGQDYVFTGPEGGLVNPNYLRDRVWYPTLAKAKLRRRVMYQTRHTFASNALAAGEAPSWVAAMLGHTTPEMLFTVYARWIPNRTRRDGSALVMRMTESGTGEIRAAESVRTK
ncbi:MAG TPA: site-specific integrase [Methylomirabilota bacterium]|jgi:integrase|nr:site-specific integrase [Methylomirabilota bacterium]